MNDLAEALQRRVLHPAVSRLLRAGIGVSGARLLTVRGRKTGEPRSAPVNPLTLDGRRYLVAPTGQTQWVRNLRAAGACELRLGRRRERFTAAELPDTAKTPVLRAYLARWGWQVRPFFGDVRADSPDPDLHRVAPDHPVFALRAEPAQSSARIVPGVATEV